MHGPTRFPFTIAFVVLAAFLLVPGHQSDAQENENDREMPEPSLPEGMRGFAGMLEGTVVHTWRHGFTVRVTRIRETWRHSEASNPRAALEQTLLINAKWERVGGEDSNRWRAVPRQVRWIATLERDQRVVVDVRNVEEQRLHIMELTREQRERLVQREEEEEKAEAERREEERREEEERRREENAMPSPELPEALRGFRGQLRGEVVRTWEHGFTLKVTHIARTWRGSTATNPRVAIGRTLLINASWERVGGADSTRWRAVPQQVRWIALLRPEQEVTVDVGNLEQQRLHILELTREQREELERAERERERERN